MTLQYQRPWHLNDIIANLLWLDGCDHAQVYSHPKAKAVELLVVDALLEAEPVRRSCLKIICSRVFLCPQSVCLCPTASKPAPSCHPVPCSYLHMLAADGLARWQH